MADEKDTEQSAIGTPIDGRLLLQMQIDRLSQSLQKRTNPSFDPALMKMAAGFAKPTKTGSFFESLGYAGEEYANETEKQRERLDAEQKLQLELFQKQYELQQEQAGQDFLDKLLTGKSGAPVGGVTKEGSPVAITGNSAVDLALSGNMKITDDVILAAKRARVPKATIEVLEKMQENQRKATETEQKEFNLVTTPIPYINESVPHTIAQDRIINGLKQKASIMKANGASDSDIQKLFFDYYASEGLVATRESKTGIKTFETPAERTSRIQTEQKEKETDIDINKEDIKKIESARDNSVHLINNGKAVYDVANNPATAGTFGILQKPGFITALGELIKEPLRVGDISIGVPSVENVARKFFKSQEEIDAATAVASNLSQLELAFSQSFRGQGQVSDNERLIVRAVGPSLNDSPKVASLKAESIIARGEFDNAIAKEYQKFQDQTGKSFRAFKGTDEYTAIKNGYDSKLTNIMVKYGLKKSDSNPSTQKPRGKLESFIRSKSEESQNEETT